MKCIFADYGNGKFLFCTFFSSFCVTTVLRSVQDVRSGVWACGYCLVQRGLAWPGHVCPARSFLCQKLYFPAAGGPSPLAPSISIPVLYAARAEQANCVLFPTFPTFPTSLPSLSVPCPLPVLAWCVWPRPGQIYFFSFLFLFFFFYRVLNCLGPPPSYYHRPSLPRHTPVCILSHVRARFCVRVFLITLFLCSSVLFQLRRDKSFFLLVSSATVPTVKRDGVLQHA